MTNNKPNILFILIDDMGWKDLGCYGSDFYETPNIDKLAKDSMLFTDAYAACPVCSPTRASILSGKYPARVGVTDWIGAHTKGKLIDAPYIDHLPLTEISLAKALRQGGYDTWHVGKWHLGTQAYYPQHHGFNVNIGGCHKGSPNDGYFTPYNLEHLPDGPEGEYLTDRLTTDAIDLINNKGDQPFFMYLSHYTVHTPIEAKEADIKRFEDKAKALGLDTLDPFEIGEHFSCDHKSHLNVKRRTLQSDPTYAAMVWNLDENIGRVMDALEANGLKDDTIIFFTSDNGGLATAEGSPTCNSPLNEGKGWMYEGGVREPLLVKWPGVTDNACHCKVAVSSPDFYPTILEMAGLDLMPKQHVDGESLLGLLKGANDLKREALYWHYPHYGNQGGTPGSSIRMGDYKLIEFFEDNRIELYNLVDDLGENKDLSMSMPELAKELQDKLAKWRTDIEALIPKANPDYKEIKS